MSERAASSVTAWEALFRAQVAVLRQLNREFPAESLTFNEYDVIFNLSQHEGRRLRIRDLNRYLLLTQPSVSRLVDRLVARGLVRKEADPGDARGIVVCITEEGYSLFRSVAVVHAQSIARHVGSALTAAELAQLEYLTTKLRASIESAGS